MEKNFGPNLAQPATSPRSAPASAGASSPAGASCAWALMWVSPVPLISFLMSLRADARLVRPVPQEIKLARFVGVFTADDSGHCGHHRQRHTDDRRESNRRERQCKQNKRRLDRDHAKDRKMDFDEDIFDVFEDEGGGGDRAKGKKKDPSKEEKGEAEKSKPR